MYALTLKLGCYRPSFCKNSLSAHRFFKDLLSIFNIRFQALKKMSGVAPLIPSKVVKTHSSSPILLLVNVTFTKEKEYQTPQEIKKYHN